MAAAAGGGGGRRSGLDASAATKYRWPDDTTTVVDSRRLFALVGDHAVQRAFFFPHAVMNTNTHAIGFMDRKSDPKTEMMWMLFSLFLANHYRRRVGRVEVTGTRASLPATTMTMTLIKDPATKRRVGFMFLQWEQRIVNPGGDLDQKSNASQQEQLKRQQRDRMPFNKWCEQVFVSPGASKLHELAHNDTPPRSIASPLHPRDLAAWSSLCSQNALSLWARAAGLYIACANPDQKFDEDSTHRGALAPQFGDSDWSLNPNNVFSLANAIGHLMLYCTEYRPKYDPSDPDEPEVPLTKEDYLLRWMYGGGPTEEQARDEGLPVGQIMSHDFAAILREGRTWTVSPLMSHVLELTKFEFPNAEPDSAFDMTSEAYRSHMEIHCGTFDGASAAGVRDAPGHKLFMSLVQAHMPVSSNFDTVMMGIRQRAQAISQLPRRDEREAHLRELYPQFDHFWTASNDGGGPLKEWIEISTAHRNSPNGMSLIGMTPVCDPGLNAFDSYLDNIMLVADTTFSFVSAHRHFALGTLGIVDAGRRGKNADGLRTTIQFEGPPGQGKSRLLRRLEALMPVKTSIMTTFDSEKAKLSMGDCRVGVEFHDDVSPDSVGCPPSLPGKQAPTVYDLVLTRRAKDANQNRASGFAVQYAKASATSNETTSRTATIADGVRSTIHAKSIQYMTIFRNINADRWDMDSALFTRAIHLAMYIGNSQGVGQTSNNPALDAKQLDRAKLMFSKIMSLAVESNCQMDCGLLPEVDDTISAGVLSALARALYEQGYSGRDAELPRKREQLTVIARAAALIRAICTVFGDLGINAPDASEKFEHHHLQLLKPYLYTTRGITMYCAGIPNTFFDEEMVYVARALLRKAIRLDALAKAAATAAGQKRPGVVIESDTSEPASASNASAALRAKQQAEIDRYTSTMGFTFGTASTAVDVKKPAAAAAAASVTVAVAPAAATTTTTTTAATGLVYEDGEYIIVQNYFHDMSLTRYGKQPHDSWYISRLLDDLDREDAIEYRLPRTAIINALTDLATRIRNSDGTTFCPLRFDGRNLVINKTFMNHITSNAVYCTLQRMYATCEPTVFRQYEPSRDADGNEVFRRAATGIVGGGATGGVSYERYMEAKNRYQRRRPAAAADGKARALYDQDEIKDLVEAAESADRLGAVLLPVTGLSAEIKNPAHRNDADLEELYAMGFIDAETVLESEPSNEKIDTRLLTDYSVALKLAKQCISDRKYLPLYHSLPLNHSRLVKAHFEFQKAMRSFAKQLHSAYNGNISPFDEFGKSFMQVVATFAERCTAYRTYHAFNGNITARRVAEYLSTHGCEPRHRSGGEFQIPFRGLAARIAAHIQCYLNFVDCVRDLPPGSRLTVHTQSIIEAAHITHEEVFGAICSYWIDYNPNTALNPTYRGRWPEQEYVAPNMYYSTYRRLALTDYASLNDGEKESGPEVTLPVRQKIPEPMSRRALSAAGPKLLNQPSEAAANAAESRLDAKHSAQSELPPMLRIMAARVPPPLQLPQPPHSLPPVVPSVPRRPAAAAAAAADVAVSMDNDDDASTSDNSLAGLFAELNAIDEREAAPPALQPPPPPPPIPAAQPELCASPAAPAQQQPNPNPRPVNSIWKTLRPIPKPPTTTGLSHSGSKRKSDGDSDGDKKKKDGGDNDSDTEEDYKDGDTHEKYKKRKKTIGSKFVDDHADQSGSDSGDDQESPDVTNPKFGEEGLDAATGYAKIAGERQESARKLERQSKKFHARRHAEDLDADEADVAAIRVALEQMLKERGVKNPVLDTPAGGGGADVDDDDVDDLTPPPPLPRRISGRLRKLAADDDDVSNAAPAAAAAAAAAATTDT